MTGLAKSKPSSIRKKATNEEAFVRIPEKTSLSLQMPSCESTALFRARSRLVVNAGKMSRWVAQEIEKPVMSSRIPAVPETDRPNFHSDSSEMRRETVQKTSTQPVLGDTVKTAENSVSLAGTTNKNESLFEGRNQPVAHVGGNTRLGHQEVKNVTMSAGLALRPIPASPTSDRSFHGNATKDKKNPDLSNQF